MKKTKLNEIRAKYQDRAEQIELRVDMQVQDALVRKIAEGEGVTYADAVAMCMDSEEYPRYSIAYKLASPAWTMLRKAHPRDWHDAFRRHFVLSPQEEKCLETDYAYNNPEASVKLKWAREARKAKKGRQRRRRGHDLDAGLRGLHDVAGLRAGGQREPRPGGPAIRHNELRMGQEATA